MQPIGIFDSGMGGLTVLKTATRLLPKESFVYYGDSKNAPYGTKTKKQVIEFSKAIVEKLIDEYNVKAVVVACNTATSAAIDILRKKYDIPIIGMEPAIKPALEARRDKKIAVMATEMTLKEKKFKRLVKRFNAINKIIALPCSTLVESIEYGRLEADVIQKELEHCFKNVSLDTIESIVLGCTHFLFIKKYLKQYLQNYPITIIDGNVGTILYLKKQLQSHKTLAKEATSRDVILLNSGDRLALSKQLLAWYEERLNNG